MKFAGSPQARVFALAFVAWATACGGSETDTATGAGGAATSGSSTSGATTTGSGGTIGTGGAIGAGGAGGQGGGVDASSERAADVVVDGIISNEASAECRGISCAPSELCIHPGCGGPMPACDPLGEGGICKPGWTYQPNCFMPGSPPGPGCLPPPCQPAPAFCAPRPASCDAGVTCACLPFNICTGEAGFGGECGLVSGRDVTCFTAAR